MSGAAPPLKVGWKVSSLSAGMASLRYRALLPILALEGEGVECRLFRSGLETNLEGLDALVIVKSFSAADIALAQRARAGGIRVIFDLCDNIFIPHYGEKKGGAHPAQMLAAMADHLDCVVTTTEPLAQAVRAALPGVPVEVIPDGIDNAETLRESAALLRKAAMVEKSQRTAILKHKIHNVLVRLKEEGPRLLFPLVKFVVRRAWREVQHYKAKIRNARRAPRKTAEGPADALPAPGAKPPQYILWFGNHGAAYARFGMLDLLEIRGALEAIARERDVELVVISNNREKYDGHIKPLAIRSRYVEWTPHAVESWLGRASVVVVPNTLDPFSLCKSANRTVLALSQSVPVVATPTPALDPLAACIHTGDTLEGLRRYLDHPQAGREDAAAGHALAQRLFGPEALACAWRELLARPARRNAASGQAPHTIVVLHLPQDLDLAVPVLRAAASQGRSVLVWCSASLIAKSPRVLGTLRAMEVPFSVIQDEGLRLLPPMPASARALLTIAETNLSPHRFSRRMAEFAQAQGLFVATLQHGFENVGLTYSDAVHPISKIDFAARRIYIWGPPSTLHPQVGGDVRARCLPVGCPKDVSPPAAELSGLLPSGMPVIGVFENLHWHRYDDAYRKAFLEGVVALASDFPQACFLVKPHHAGLWLTARYEGDKPAGANLVIADPRDPLWENHTAPALLGSMAGVITTPSTVALDAARRGMPVAVFAGNLELDNYRPLPLLGGTADWKRFVADLLDTSRRPALESASREFEARVIVPGDAAQRIASDLAAANE